VGRTAIVLLLIRLVSGGTLTWEAVSHARGAPLGAPTIFHIFSGLMGMFLAAGYRTQLAGGATAAVELSLAMFGPGDRFVHILMATFAIGLALLGPGAWSMDARRAGWKRIEIPKRHS
jgi:putative oxidoreductase